MSNPNLILLMYKSYHQDALKITDTKLQWYNGTLLTLHIGITELNENNYKYQCWEKRQNWKN